MPDLTGEPFPRGLLLRLKHLILSHHGTYEFGSPKLPMTPEAIALHHLDNFDAKVHSFTRDIREDRNSASAWTPFNQSLQRRLFKGGAEARRRMRRRWTATEITHEGDRHTASSTHAMARLSPVSSPLSLCGLRRSIMPDLEDQILAALARKSYEPLKPKALARKLGVPAPQYADFRRALRDLLQQGRIEIGKNHTVRPAPPHGTVTGTYRRTGDRRRLRPAALRRGPAGAGGPHRRGRRARRRHRRRGAGPHHAQAQPARRWARAGEILRVLERATRQFVGTYFERDGAGLRPRGRHRLQPQHLRRRPRGQGRPAGRQGRLRDAPLPVAGGPRRGRHHRGARAARPAGRRYAVDHPRLRPARRVPRGRPGRRPATRPPPSARTTSTAARTSPATSSSPSTRPTPATSTTPCR